jgi:3-deoxy-D-manno-octulosonate 8-phosphate phosphatase (KDO 8-P phosphatase)
MENTLFNRLRNIRALVFDADGVLTDGSFLILENGEKLRTVSSKDGFAIGYAADKRYRIGVLMEDESAALNTWLKTLGIREGFFNANNKMFAFEKFIIDTELDVQQILYMGDDINDLPPLRIAGLAACPQDAAPEVKAACHYIATAKGGEGCVREVIEMVMKAHKQWDF